MEGEGRGQCLPRQKELASRIQKRLIQSVLVTISFPNLFLVLKRTGIPGFSCILQILHFFFFLQIEGLWKPCIVR